MKRWFVWIVMLLLVGCDGKGITGSSGDKFLGRWVDPQDIAQAVDIEKIGDHFKVTSTYIRPNMYSGYRKGQTQMTTLQNGALYNTGQAFVIYDDKTDSIMYIGNQFKRVPAPVAEHKTLKQNLFELGSFPSFKAYFDADIRTDKDGIKYVWYVADFKQPGQLKLTTGNEVSSSGIRVLAHISCRERKIKSAVSEAYTTNYLTGDFVGNGPIGEAVATMYEPKPNTLSGLLVDKVCGF